MSWIDNALQAYVIAASEGKEHDSEHVKSLFYKFYQEDIERGLQA